MDNQNEKNHCVNCGIKSVPLHLGLDGRLHCADCTGMLLPKREPTCMQQLEQQVTERLRAGEKPDRIRQLICTDRHCTAMEKRRLLRKLHMEQEEE